MLYRPRMSACVTIAQGTFRLSGALITEAASERWHCLAEAALHNPSKQWPVIMGSARNAFRSIVTRFLYAVFPEV